MIIKKNKCIKFSSKWNDSVYKSVNENRPAPFIYHGDSGAYGSRWTCGHQSLDRRFGKVNKKYRVAGESTSDV